jgi:DNA-binding MarR family transcriptional regulator
MGAKAKSKELAGYVRAIKEKLQRADKWNPKTAAVLNMQEAQALLSIGTGGRMAMSEIAGRLQLSLSSMTGVIDKLEKKKFVSRGRQEQDRRVVEVALTRAGRKFYDLVEDAHVQVMEKFLKALNAVEQDTLLTLFRKITANLK